MARRPTKDQKRLFDALINRLTPELQAAFEAAIQDLKDGIDWQELIAALERQNLLDAIAALNIEPSAFYGYATAKAGAFAEGGALAATTIIAPGAGAVGVRFDMRDPRAESWIARNVWGHIEGWMQEEQLQVIRDTVLSGFADGRHPHSIARDIAGRVVNGQRQGGVIGLDAGRAHRLTAVTRGMETAEGVRGLVIQGRDGKLRLRYAVNKATENRILRAYREGKAVPVADRDMSIRQFSNMLLKERADTLAQDATAEAVFAGRKQEWDQTLEKLGYPPEAVLKVWRHGGGPKDPRPHHVAMSGQAVRGLDAPFEFSNGARLRWPHDTEGPVSEVTRCTCGVDIRLDPRWGVA